MRIYKKALIAVVAVVIGAFVPTTFAFAHGDDHAEHCTITEARINTRLTSARSLRNERVAIYEKALTKTSAIIESAKAKGYDTAKLEAAKATAQTAYDSYSTNTTNFETALKSTKVYVCGESQGMFLNSLATARTELTSVRTSSIALKTAVVSQLVPALKDYATWLKDQAKINVSAEVGDE